MERKTIWLCGACSRTGKTRETVGDESCYLHAVEVYEDSIERDAKGQIVKATAVKSEEVWYRFEDVQYAAPVDEFDLLSGIGQLVVELRKFQVIRHTPKGVWLRLYSGDKRFVLKGAHRKFACPTLALAKESFIARKKSQASIYLARANRAKLAMVLAEKLKVD